MYRLNGMGDPSSNGINRSFGTMVNYLYNLDMLEENSRMYRGGVIKSFPGDFRSLLFNTPRFRLKKEEEEERGRCLGN